ncbi:hypothetical protein [Domibacillus indicus]|uniref:hypothetical protein n=1 Tax=Domibacillus indicus TaxID=1437523 RepID=UPI0006180AF1|nr:hypothetical protein [Domibacillus indicus]
MTITVVYKDEILNLNAFQTIFEKIKKADPKMGLNIEQSLKAAVSESHDLLAKVRTSDQAQLALMKEQIFIQAQSSQYLNITDEITQKKNNLLEFNPKAYHDFMNEVERELLTFINNKKWIMYKEIEKDGAWYSGLRDSAKKSGGSLLNAAMKGINSISKEFKGKEVFDQTDMVDAKSIVESLLEKHLSNKIVTDAMGDIFKNASKRYEEKWIEQIASNVPNIKRLSAFSIANSAQTNLKVDFQFGTAEQVLAMGLGSAVIGAVGLAIGWHTLTYAMLNVFPPIALFTALITVATGFITKDKAIENRKKDIDEAVNRYHQFFLQQLYTLKLKDMNNKSISNYMEELGTDIIREAIAQWEKNYFGNLKMEHFRELNQAFVKHLMYVNEAMEELTT